ncbi:PorT family protein [Flavobacterium sp. xlx-214]|uniref:porin family protein n=1 Tax=unclassified Flavobacterium TaxID=196869 RepID=UPI0013D37826|nr:MULTISPECIES: porin family protein [unclassified Flavobacterium]MBA5793882.1 PorT family protein [Flavobacterium sp. xlx-221]QMI84817.1 PorT family protein [Flavobacterium sp. xlx-214]
MKKIALTFLGLVAFSTSALAQQEVKFGPKAGVNFATLNGKDAKDAKMLIGFHVGAFAEIKFNEKFAVQPEVVFSAQGAKTEYSETVMGVTANYEGKAKINYINVPIMAKYYVAPSFAIEAGPYVGFLATANAESKGTVGGVTQEFDADVKDQTNSIDFGVGVGASFNMDSGLFIGARYNLGLAKTGKDYDETVNGVRVKVDAEDVKNAVIQVSVGYKF